MINVKKDDGVFSDKEIDQEELEDKLRRFEIAFNKKQKEFDNENDSEYWQKMKRYWEGQADAYKALIEDKFAMSTEQFNYLLIKFQDSHARKNQAIKCLMQLTREAFRK